MAARLSLAVTVDTTEAVAALERLARTLTEPTPIFDRLAQESSGALAFRDPGDQGVLPGQPVTIHVGTRVVTDDDVTTTRHADHRPSDAHE